MGAVVKNRSEFSLFEQPTDQGQLELPWEQPLHGSHPFLPQR